MLPAEARLPSAALDALDRLLVLEERERGALADRLHDGPLQDLVATRYLADLTVQAAARSATPATVAERLGAVRDAAQDALVGTRRLLGSLTARCADGTGLTQALAALGTAAGAAGGAAGGGAGGAAGGLAVEVQAADAGTLPPGIAIVAYRLVQALLADTAERGATTAVVRARRTPEALEVSVAGSVAPDLEAPAVARWVVRIGMLGGTILTDPTGTTTARLPMPAGAVPEPLVGTTDPAHTTTMRPEAT
jgi:signal transduction histidine kinase